MTVISPGRRVIRHTPDSRSLSSSACTEQARRDDRRSLDPEGAEERELLALRVGGVERKPARRQSVGQALGNGAEIARAEKHADLVEIVRPVDRPMDAEAREAEIAES